MMKVSQLDAMNDDCANPQDGEMDLNRDNEFMQAGIAELTACFDDEFFFNVE